MIWDPWIAMTVVSAILLSVVVLGAPSRRSAIILSIVVIVVIALDVMTSMKSNRLFADHVGAIPSFFRQVR